MDPLTSATTDDGAQTAEPSATDATANDVVTDALDPPAAPPQISISPPSLSHPEGDAGYTAYEFTVSRTGDLSEPSVVGYSVNPSGANPASDDDFGGIVPRGAVEIAAGEDAVLLTIEVEGDQTYEADEMFTLMLAEVTNSNIVDGEADAVIVNDDEEAIDPLIPVRISFEGTDAGFANSFGIYDKSAMTAKLLVPDLKAEGEGAMLYEADLTQQELDDLGFFLLPDGDSQNPDLASLLGVELMVENTADGYAIIADEAPLAGVGAPALFSDAALNPDGLEHFVTDGTPENYFLAVEDLVGGGDLDFNDATFLVETGAPSTAADDPLI